MTRIERDALISAYEKAYDPLREMVFGLSREQLTFLPPGITDPWSVDEHLVHLLDTDCNTVRRIRGAVGEPGLPANAWDQDAWKAGNLYAKSDGKAALSLAVSLRAFIGESLRELSDEAWDAAFCVHAVRGCQTLPDTLKGLIEHADTHFRYAERNIAAWKAGKAARS